MTAGKSESAPALRVALIGYGVAGAIFHAPIIRCTNGLKMAAIVTANEERACQARRDFPDAKIVDQAEAIFSDAHQYDLVVIAAPNKFHFPLAKSSLEAGLATIVDKPLATSVKEAQALIDLSISTGKLLTVYQNRRWDNDFLTLKKIVQGNLLGPLTRFESRFERFRPQPKASAWRESAHSEDAGGLLFDLGSHLIDQVCNLFGKPISVYAELAAVRPGAKIDDDVFVALRFPTGMQAHLWATVVARINGPRFRLHGLKGSFEKFGLDPQEDALRSGKRPDDASWGWEPEAKWGRLCTTIDGVSFDGKVETEPGSYQSFYANVRDALLGKCESAVNAHDSVLILRIIEAAQLSGREARVVQI